MYPIFEKTNTRKILYFLLNLVSLPTSVNFSNLPFCASLSARSAERCAICRSTPGARSPPCLELAALRTVSRSWKPEILRSNQIKVSPPISAKDLTPIFIYDKILFNNSLTISLFSLNSGLSI